MLIIRITKEQLQESGSRYKILSPYKEHILTSMEWTVKGKDDIKIIWFYLAIKQRIICKRQKGLNLINSFIPLKYFLNNPKVTHTNKLNLLHMCNRHKHLYHIITYQCAISNVKYNTQRVLLGFNFIGLFFHTKAFISKFQSLRKEFQI